MAKLDKRTREAGYLDWVKHDLTQHIGGSPTIPQKMLIDRAAILALRLAKIDQKIIDDADLTLHDNNAIIAWSNALRRTLTALGIETPAADPAPPPALRDIISRAASAGSDR